MTTITSKEFGKLGTLNLLEQVAGLIKGGGGQKTLATAGGQDVSQLKTIIEKVRELL